MTDERHIADMEDRVVLTKVVRDLAVDRYPDDEFLQMTYAHHLMFHGFMAIEATIQHFGAKTNISYERKDNEQLN